MTSRKPMCRLVESYIEHQTRLGYSISKELGRLRRFARFMDEHAPGKPVTEALIVEWASEGLTEPLPFRMYALRKFIPWLSLRDERIVAPRRDLFRHPRHIRRLPYLYTPEEVAALLDAVWNTDAVPWGEWPRASHAVTLGLLESTGIRVTEAVNLDDDDVDLEHGHLYVRFSKNLPLRLVPLHETGVAALRRYRDRRRRYCPHPLSRAFILSSRGHRLGTHRMDVFFAKVRKAAGVPFRPHRRQPRLYDFRHTFASRHLLRAYRENRDIDVEIADLSVYLGHQHIAHTYWYLSALPELRTLCAERFRRYAEELRREGRP